MKRKSSIKKVLQILLGVIVLFSFNSCKENDFPLDGKVEVIKVASITAPPTLYAEHSTYYIWDQKVSDWRVFYYPIADFIHDKGYEYELKIRYNKVENPAMDEMEYYCDLLEVISKIEADSDIELPPFYDDFN